MMPSIARSTPVAAVPAERRELIDQALAAGIAHHRAGDLAAAAACYGAILELDPEHPQSLHLCGVVAHQRGAPDLARTLIAHALRIHPEFAEAHNTLGVVLRADGDDREARQCFERALSLQPDYPDALQNLGALHAATGERTRAIALFRRALALAPDNLELRVLLGAALTAADQSEAALGVLDTALAIAPKHVPALLGRAAALRCLGRYDEACRVFEHAIVVDPASLDAWIGLGTTTLDCRSAQAAVRIFDRALAIDPANPLTRFNRALALLLSGRLEEGWQDYAWRWRSPAFDSQPRACRLPRWDGSRNADLGQRTILLWREQGIGDELLFASMLDEARAHFEHCVVECEPRLTPLLRRSFPGIEFVSAGFPPHPRTAAADIDCHAPLGDLAPLLRPRLESFPRRLAYLRADAGRVAHWRAALAALGSRPKVGICWRSSDVRGVRALACSALPQWHRLLREIQVDWINLQYDRCDDELAAAHAATGVRIHRFRDIDMYRDIDETAALIGALDLVVSAPTTVSVLAAALGVPTWQLSSGADWQTHGTKSVPWLPSVRRFYRSWEQDWPSVLDLVRSALHAWLEDGIAAD